ncbi:hypothetical protein J5N97_021520 [Dioscorea zingiberensis]|uniref:S-acyltransferase n=1 Tax=Dioscorea zingiberensis TaxID=325984 RepID=A0A9D5HEB2_9LILI|nr:hypothetical protein J5N97_021520 [Dioscorea zingiberensis]
MYVAPPPRDLDPVAAAMARGASPRVYEVWRGSNVFILQGRFIFGPDVRSLFLTVFLIVAPVAVFCVFVARKLMDHFPHHLGVSIVVVAVALTLYDLTLLLLTSGRDPGIIPRNMHPPEPDSFEGITDAGGEQTPQFRIPRMKDVTVNGITVKIKYCDTCMLYRPPRCSHCSICNNCVERFDHHCPWVGQCIGRRNYRFFFMFVFSTTLLCIYVFGFCWVTTIWRAMLKTPASIALIIYTFVSVWFVGGLSVFHLYLISSNQTTYENFRYRYDRRANPYNLGVVENFKEVFFTSIPPSKSKFRARVAHEEGIKSSSLKSSSMSEGFISPSMGKASRDPGMGVKLVTWGEAGAITCDLEAGMSNNAPEDKDSRINNASPDAIQNISSEGLEGQALMQPRRSSWGRKSGSWDISPDIMVLASGVGDSNRLSSGSSRRASINSSTR